MAKKVVAALSEREVENIIIGHLKAGGVKGLSHVAWEYRDFGEGGAFAFGGAKVYADESAESDVTPPAPKPKPNDGWTAEDDDLAIRCSG